MAIMKGYWDIDDYLAGEENISFTSQSPEISNFLSIPIQNQAKKIPMWLAKALVIRDLCTITPPGYLHENFFGNLSANPEILTLSSLSDYFYEISSFFSHLLQNQELLNLVVKMFITRTQSLQKFLEVNTREKGFSKLANMEKVVYENTRKSALEIQQWKERTHEKSIGNAARPRKRLKVNSFK